MFAACGSGSSDKAAPIVQLPKETLNKQFLGLTPTLEDIKERVDEQQANSYVEGVALYSLRAGERLEATLQVSKLTSKARPEDEKFRAEVAGQIGGTTVQAFSMEGRTVYRSALRRQSLTSWFRGDYFMILSVREGYATPRALLRELLKEVKPG